MHVDRFVVPCNVVTRLHSHDSSTPIAPERPSDPTMDPFSLSTGIVGLIVVALNLVVGTTGLIDKTIAAHDEAAVELKGLEKDLKQLQKENGPYPWGVGRVGVKYKGPRIQEDA